MQAIRGRPSVRRCSGRPSIFPSRPDLKTRVLPLRLQQPTHTDALASSRSCPVSLRGMARIVAAITPPIAALPFFEAGAYAQNGEFSKAVETGQRALQLATEQNNFGLADSLRSELDLYRDGRPCLYGK